MASGNGYANFFSGNVPFIIFFAFFALLAWDITSPMATAIIWAGMLSFVATPLNKKILKALRGGKYPSISAAVTMTALLLLCFVPVLLAHATRGRGGRAGRTRAETIRPTARQLHTPENLGE